MVPTLVENSKIFCVLVVLGQHMFIGNGAERLRYSSEAVISLRYCNSLLLMLSKIENFEQNIEQNW